MLPDGPRAEGKPAATPAAGDPAGGVNPPGGSVGSTGTAAPRAGYFPSANTMSEPTVYACARTAAADAAACASVCTRTRLKS